MITGIDHVQIVIPEGGEGRARTFFIDLLGLQELPKPDSLKGRGGVWFSCGAKELHVGIENDFRPALKAHPAFQVEDLGVMIKRLDEAGIQMFKQPPLPGARRVFVDDPFGNRIELIERE